MKLNTLSKLAGALLGMGVILVSLPQRSAADQSELFDPTQPNWFGVNAKPKAQRSLVLNSLVTGTKRRIAIVNGELLREGDTYRGLKLTQILNDRVLLKSAAGKITTLKLERTKNASVHSKSKGKS